MVDVDDLNDKEKLKLIAKNRMLQDQVNYYDNKIKEMKH